MSAIVVTGCGRERAAKVIGRLDSTGAAVLHPGEEASLILHIGIDKVGGDTYQHTTASFPVRNLGPQLVRAGAAVHQSGGKLTVKDSSGCALATLKPIRLHVPMAIQHQHRRHRRDPRRKLRRIGGSDRLWRALRGGRPTR